MAEHLRHQLTRDGVVLRPSRVHTLAQFLEQHTTLKAPPPHLVQFRIQRALEQQRPARFQAVAEFEGLHAAMADLFEEAPANALPGDLAALAEQVERELRERGMGLRRMRLMEAAGALENGPASARPAIFDGFFTFSVYETRLLIALSRCSQVVLTVPDWPASARARESLLGVGFEEYRLRDTFRAPRRTVFSAATIEREMEEIAKRILSANRSGRPFREIGVVLRARNPYAPLLETTLARFGIPARAYFSDSLARHPAVAFLCGILRSLSAGWDHAVLLEALRMPVGRLGATPSGDRLDFDWRKAIPGRGLPFPESRDAPLGRLTEMDGWRRDRLPAQDWAARIKSLRPLVPIGGIEDRVPRLQADAWRSTAAALDEFERILEQTAEILGSERVPLGSFCNFAQRALDLAPLRILDRRRDVVHIMDVFEARQWELPVVFVCGLTERHFPQYHREDPLLSNAARTRIGLETSGDRQAQERSLFEFAISRATEEIVLSYPRFDEKGEDTLRSFFLEQEGAAVQGSVRPRPARPILAAASGSIDDDGLRQSLAERHRALSPSSIETFAQCPFKFFASKTLRVHERPPEPRDRLDVLLQGNIVHRVLAEWLRTPLLGAAIFHRVFEEECGHYRILRDYRTEAVRLEMLRNFSAFIEDALARLPGWDSRTEQEFEFALYPGLALRGRVDRLEQNSRGEALVIDYKYSAKEQLRKRMDKSEEGREVQTGIYLLAAERHFGLKPVGMLFCGLKKGVVWDGWHVAVSGLEEAGNSCTPEVLRKLMATAEKTAIETHASVLSGRIAVEPADSAQCKWCDYRDACRVETIAAARGAGA